MARAVGIVSRHQVRRHAKSVLFVMALTAFYLIGWRLSRSAPTKSRAKDPFIPAIGADAFCPSPGALGLPIAGIDIRSVHDNFNDTRDGTRRHEALDILAPRGTRVLAVDDGVVRKLFTSTRGGLSIYQYDPAQTYCYFYAHLDGYAEGLHEGQPLRRGDVIGFVGTTGNAPKNTPHLHLALYRLDAEKRWWTGTPIDIYPILLAVR